MLKFLDTKPDVIAMRIGGKIEGADLDTILDRLEPMMATGAPVHVFVECQEITGIAIDGLAQHWTRSLPLLGQLPKFGRVAVVADQAWLRWATKAESMLLPHISYRTFTPERSAEALAWVKDGGESDR